MSNRLTLTGTIGSGLSRLAGPAAKKPRDIDVDIIAAQVLTDGLFSEEALHQAASDGVNLFARLGEKQGNKHVRNLQKKQHADAEQTRIDSQLAGDYFQRPQWNHGTKPPEPQEKADVGFISLSQDKPKPLKKPVFTSVLVRPKEDSQHPIQMIGEFQASQSKSEMSRMRSETEDSEKEALRAKFSALDQNGDGSISREEMLGLLKRMNPALTDEELDKLFKAADKNGDGKLQFVEFMDFLWAK